MKKGFQKRLIICFAVLLLVGGSVSVLAAAQGSADNPLVTLSYIKNTFTQDVLKEVDKKISDTQAKYAKTLEDKITAYRNELNGSSGPGGTGSASFVVVDLQSGQTLQPAVGAEVMLRVGTAQCVSAASPGLIDGTSGGVLEGGGSLVKNHLYLVTIADRGVKATGGTVKLLVRGSYTIG